MSFAFSTRSLKTLILLFLLVIFLGGCLSGCTVPQVSAEDRLFLDVSLDLIGTTTLPKQDFEGEPVGGISAIVYDIPSDRLYALSDNRDRPRFYTFRATQLDTDSPQLTVESVTYLKDIEGKPYAPGVLDPEGMAITPTGTLLISSEGSPTQRIEPAIGEYELDSGQLKQVLPLPVRYIPDSVLDPEASAQSADQTQGVQENLSFESLTINVSSGAGGVYEPYRLFVATEGPLLQDLDFEPEIPYKNRMLHYTLDPYQTTLISEHLYEMELAPTGGVLHGLSEIELLDQGGHFLGIERSYGFQGFDVKLYQLASGGATDISAVESLRNGAGGNNGISPIRKELVLDLAALPVPLQNYEAMTLGPSQRLFNGIGSGNRAGRSETLLVMSDDNFAPEQETRLLVFRLIRS
ncbi:MAG: esterase-like activity of phytase family protein [Cyanobacteria bacterium P01_D01_bin.105]